MINGNFFLFQSCNKIYLVLSSILTFNLITNIHIIRKKQFNVKPSLAFICNNRYCLQIYPTQAFGMVKLMIVIYFV
jgi:hypothetical protein